MGTRLNSPDGVGAIHFVTLCVRDRQKVFGRAEYAQACCSRLQSEAQRHPGKLVAFVVMPDHLHFLVDLEDGQLGRFLRRFKSGFTLQFDDLCLRLNHSKRGEWLQEKGRRELWQDSKHSIPLWSDVWIEQKIRYLHENPVRAGLVECAADYRWSSYGAYFPETHHVPPVVVDVWNPWGD